MLTIAQKLPYTSLASANSEASGWNPTELQAHAAFHHCAVFLCATVFSLWAGCVESRKAHRFPVTSAFQSTRSALHIWNCGRQVQKNLLQETTMSSQSQLYDALEALINHNLTSELSEAAQLRIEAMTRTILSAAADAEFPTSVAAVAIDLYQISRLFKHQEA